MTKLTLLWLVILLPSLTSTVHAQSSQNKLTVEDQAAIKQLWADYGVAIGRKDAAVAASLFTTDGDALAIDGELLNNPSEVEKYYNRKLPDAYKNMSISDITINDAKPIGVDIALVNGSWKVHGIVPEPFQVRSTFIVRREKNGWRYVAIRLMVPFKTSI